MTDPTLFTDRTAEAECGVGVPGAGAAGGFGDGTGGPREWAAVTALLMSPVAVGELGDGELEDRLRLVGRCESRLAAVKAETVVELSRRRGEANAAGVLRDGLGESRSAAKRQVKDAGRLRRVPGTARALAGGAITPEHARLIAEAAEQAPAGAPIDEAALLAAAQREPADLFGRTVREHLNDRARDDLPERRKQQRAQRKLSFKQQPDGMFELFGRFDPVSGSRIETALTAAANRLWHAEDAKDRATPRQRMADALELLVTGGGGGNAGDAGRRAAGGGGTASGGTTSAGGKASGWAQGVDLLVIADYDILTGALRDARLIDGTPLTAEELIRLACDANILPALFDRKSEPLWLGRGKRHASARQRAVLAARDGGCVGCGASANWCQAHHIIHWEHGGPTDIDNLCLLCSHCHHHEVHERGAQVVRGPTGKFTLQRPEHPPPSHDRLGHRAANLHVKQPLRC